MSRGADFQTEAITEEESGSCLIPQLEHTVFGSEFCGRYSSRDIQHNKR